MYGRPPAPWLISESIKQIKVATFRQISKSTNTPIRAVRKLSENYADFLRLAYKIDSEYDVSNALVSTKRLAYLHAILAADRIVRIQIGRYQADHPHSMREAFTKLLAAARKSGLRTSMKVPRDPEDIIQRRDKLLAMLKIPVG